MVIASNSSWPANKEYEMSHLLMGHTFMHKSENKRNIATCQLYPITLHECLHHQFCNDSMKLIKCKLKFYLFFHWTNKLTLFVFLRSRLLLFFCSPLYRFPYSIVGSLSSCQLLHCPQWQPYLESISLITAICPRKNTKNFFAFDPTPQIHCMFNSIIYMDSHSK